MLGGLVFIVLPLAVFAFHGRAPVRGWREASVAAALAWATGVGLLTEMLSVFGAWRFWPTLVAWSAVNVGVAWLAWRGWQSGTRLPRIELGSAFERVVVLAIVGLIGLALVIALVAPPNTPDALSYHLSRQVMWLQQGGLSPFVTVDDRALVMPPLAEMMQAHAMLLSGGDRWANFPQWLGYVLGCLITSMLARELGASRRGQWLAALVFATLPMAFLEASSAKNDLLVAVWLALFAWLALRIVRGESVAARDWAMAGAALGVALATKGTALLFALPVLALLMSALWREARRAWWLPVFVLLVAGPHWARNVAWSGSPIGVQHEEGSGAVGNELHSWRSVLSNAARNATLHAVTPSPAINATLARTVARFHDALGLHASDPRTTLVKFDYAVDWQPASEVIAGAPAQWWLGLAALAWWIVRGPRRGPVSHVALIITGSALLYCVLLKWQPWGARLHLPGFILFAALIAWAADRIGGWASAVAGLICFAGWLPSAEPDTRPWWTAPTIFTTSRWENYFRSHPLDRASFDACVLALANAKIESLQIITKHGFPYPLMRRFLDGGGSRAKIWGALPTTAATLPDGVVLMEPFERALPLYLRLPGATERFRAVGATDPIGLYVSESRARALAATLPLPRYVGWEVAENLGSPELEAHGDRVWRVRRLLATEARLTFRRESASQHVQIEAVNVSAVPCDLELRLDGRRVATLRFEPGLIVQAADVPIVPAGDRAELTLVVAESARPALRLVALRILD